MYLVLVQQGDVAAEGAARFFCNLAAGVEEPEVGIGRLELLADVLVVGEDDAINVESKLGGQLHKRGHGEGRGRRGDRANHLRADANSRRGEAAEGGTRSGKRSCGASKKPYIAGWRMRAGRRMGACGTAWPGTLRKARRHGDGHSLASRLPSACGSFPSACPFMHGLPLQALLVPFAA